MKKTLAACIVLMVLLTSCQDNEPSGNHSNKEYQPIELNPAQTRVAQTNNNFALSMMKASFHSYDNKSNILYSPFSLAASIGMLANGADGSTREEILKVLGHNSVEDINSFYQLMSIRLMEADDRVELALANSLWVNNDISVKESFASNLKSFFDAEIFRTDLSSPVSMDKINQWCAKATKNQIPKFLDNVPGGIFTILNATYFSGKWTTPFPASDTAERTFIFSDGTEGTVPTMKGKIGKTLYFESDCMESIRIPYGNGAFYLEIILPKPGMAMETVVSSLVQHIEIPDYELEEVNATLFIPKFKFDHEQDVASFLQGLGMKAAFDMDSADFSEMVDNKAYINSIMQKSCISVDEEGTVAATVTGSIMTSGLVRQMEFRANRPFIFLIKEKSTSTILFSGIVQRP